tara:strand:- start:253 stop:588 length:336 start_codon:yes stop_codon:yes gene_type:complete
MKILTTTSIQTIKFIPRELVSAVTLTLTNKNTRTSSTVSVGVANSNGYMSLTGSFSLIENTNYSMEVTKASGDVIYRDTIFCTNQTDLDKFDVHKNDYVTEDTFDNEFIVL